MTDWWSSGFSLFFSPGTSHNIRRIELDKMHLRFRIFAYVEWKENMLDVFCNPYIFGNDYHWRFHSKTWMGMGQFNTHSPEVQSKADRLLGCKWAGGGDHKVDSIWEIMSLWENCFVTWKHVRFCPPRGGCWVVEIAAERGKSRFGKMPLNGYWLQGKGPHLTLYFFSPAEKKDAEIDFRLSFFRLWNRLTNVCLDPFRRVSLWWGQRRWRVM